MMQLSSQLFNSDDNLWSGSICSLIRSWGVSYDEISSALGFRRPPANLSGNLILEMRETLRWGTYLALQLNDITFFFLLLFLSVQPRFAVFLFVLKRGSSACIKFCLAFTIWCIDLCSVARPQPFILELSSTSSFISHPPLELNDITWGLHLIKVLYSCDGGWHCVGFR